jgi:hypothetical protein
MYVVAWNGRKRYLSTLVINGRDVCIVFDCLSMYILSIATEIRCQEMSKGGLAYEVILAEPVGVPVPRRADSPEKTPSVEEIQEKLKAAEERRRVSHP